MSPRLCLLEPGARLRSQVVLHNQLYRECREMEGDVETCWWLSWPWILLKELQLCLLECGIQSIKKLRRNATTSSVIFRLKGALMSIRHYWGCQGSDIVTKRYHEVMWHIPKSFRASPIIITSWKILFPSAYSAAHKLYMQTFEETKKNKKTKKHEEIKDFQAGLLKCTLQLNPAGRIKPGDARGHDFTPLKHFLDGVFTGYVKSSMSIIQKCRPEQP